jgi:uncharacterized membrane protein
MSFRSFTLGLAALLVLPAAAAAQELITVPDAYIVYDVTPDGEVVVGAGTGGGFIWRWRDDPAPTVIGGNDAVAVSDDGTVVVGCISDPAENAEVAARWTQATGWVSLGFLPNALSCPSKSNAYDVSGDGSQVVGLSWDGCSGRGFLWDEVNGMQELAVLGNGQNRASAIADDGSVMGGFAQGSTRSPVLWYPDLTGVELDISIGGEVYGFNNDGSLTLGNWDGDAFYMVTSTLSKTFIPGLNLDWQSIPEAITEAEDRIVGFDVSGLSTEAWTWTPGGGTVSLSSYFSSLGATGVPSNIDVATAMSDDGRVIVGRYGFPSTAYIFDTSVDPWQDVGNGLAGVSGVPNMVASGDLTVGSPTTLDVASAAPSASAWLIVGLTELLAPFKGGVMVPNPDVLIGPFATTPTGTLALFSAWPPGVPSNTESWWQMWIQDAAAVKNFSATNALLSTTP